MDSMLEHFPARAPLLALAIVLTGCAEASLAAYHQELYEQLGDAQIDLGEAIAEANREIPGTRPFEASFSPGLVQGNFEVRLMDEEDALVVLVRFDDDGAMREPWRRGASLGELEDSAILGEGTVDLEQAIITAEDEVSYSEAFEAYVFGSRIEVGVVTSSAIYVVEISPTSGRVLDVDRQIEWVEHCHPLHC